MDYRNSVTLDSDPVWPDRYEETQQHIRSASSELLLGVYHVGSTAIRDVPGKPILDIIAVYEDDDSLAAAAEALTDEDAYEPEEDSSVLIRSEENYAVFVKFHTEDDEKVRNQLAFRDYLRENPEARNEYAHVKRAAADEHPEDLEAYTQAKSDFISSILKRARDDGYFQDLPEFA
jgi:GrpB-like predicted nucleotidyltransferase (UPF0157 family)